MSKINSLLGLDPKIQRPNAYQIFGLDVLENDPAKLRAGMQTVVQRLNALREQTDPKIWATAAKSVKKAREILSDAEKKATYDNRLKSTFDNVAVAAAPPASQASPVAGSVSAGSKPSLPPKPPQIDLLAGLLPDADPFAAFDMAVALAEMPPETAEDEDLLSEVVPEPTMSFENTATAQAPAQLSNTAQLPLPSAAGPALKPVEKRRRRKKSFSMGGVFLTLFVVGLFGGIAFCMKVLMDKENARNQQVAQQSQAPRSPSTRVVLDDKSAANDNIMGDLLPSGNQQNDSGPGLNFDPMSQSNPIDPMQNVSPMESAAPMMQDPQPVVPDMNAMAPAEPAPMEPAPAPQPPAATPAMVAAGSQAADAARAAIKATDWDKMMPLAEAAVSAAANPQQADEASTRRRLVHYASEYRAAIARGLGSIEESVINIERIGPAAVVEVTPTQIVLKMLGRNKTFELAKLPSIVSHAIAATALPDDPTVVTALKGAWECLRKDSTNEYRQLAMEQWAKIAGRSPDANVDGLQAEVEAIFAGN